MTLNWNNYHEINKPYPDILMSFPDILMQWYYYFQTALTVKGILIPLSRSQSKIPSHQNNNFSDAAKADR